MGLEIANFDCHLILCIFIQKRVNDESDFKIKKSRTTWKEKAVERNSELKYQRSEVKRLKISRDKYKAELQEVKQQLEEERKKNTLPAKEKKEVLIHIVLSLFIIGHIGFRAISRVISILSPYLGIQDSSPCHQTIINWVTRYSLAKIWTYSGPPSLVFEKNKIINGAIWIIDESIGLGVGKILTVLELKIDHHSTHESPPTLRDVNCVAISVAPSWTGETIADFLQQVIQITGKPASFLKDGGTNLEKGVRLLNERGFFCHSIDDVSHIVANLLKKEYTKHPSYGSFISICGQASKKMKQTLLAALCPPKVSTKARFMNIQRLVKWANLILKHSPRGRASEGSIISKLRKSLGALSEHKQFISRFLRDASSLLKCQEVLKTKGLSLDTYNKCKILLRDIPPTSQVYLGFVTWMEKQLMVAQSLGIGSIGMPVCSDIIESLYGIGKTHGTGEIKDANRIALRLPSYCGELSDDAAEMVMGISTKQQQKIETELFSLTRQRRKVLPNPGTITDLLGAEDKQYLSLLPMPKTGEEQGTISNITEGCKSKTRPHFLDSKEPEETYMLDSQMAS